jgi:hypothetical protein
VRELANYPETSADLRTIILIDRTWEDVRSEYQRIGFGVSLPAIYRCIITFYGIDASTGRYFDKKEFKGTLPKDIRGPQGEDLYINCTKDTWKRTGGHVLRRAVGTAEDEHWPVRHGHAGAMALDNGPVSPRDPASVSPQGDPSTGG